MLLHTLLSQTTRDMPARAALVTLDGEQLSYTAFSALVNRCAESLKHIDPELGARIGIYLPKHLLSAVAPFAISSIGCVFVPINPLLTEDQISHIITDCELRVLITSPERASRLTTVIDKFELPVLLTERGEFCDKARHQVLVWEETAEMPLPADSASNQLSENANEQSATSLAALLYTSGSTGKPKGVMVSHQNLVLGAQSVNQYLDMTNEDRILAVLPFSFDYGLNQLISSVAVGACCILFEYLFPQDVVRGIEKHQVTGLAGVPTLWMQLANAFWPAGATDSVRYLTNSGGHLPQAVLRQLQSIFSKASPVLMYGLTEAFRSTYLPPEQIDKRPNSIGIAIPNATILVINDQHSLAAPGEEGELVHGGPLVTMGYWRRAEETAAVFKPLPQEIARMLGLSVETAVVWSGDRVRQDEEGYLYFLGRRDAMIKTSGYRVSSEEIEETLFAHECVDTVAAIGIPDEQLGQAIVICVTTKAAEPELSEKNLRDSLLTHCRQHLPSYLIPKAVHFFSELPRNPNGKIDRKALAAMLQQEPQHQTERVG